MLQSARQSEVKGQGSELVWSTLGLGLLIVRRQLEAVIFEALARENLSEGFPFSSQGSGWKHQSFLIIPVNIWVPDSNILG